ncbi:3-isopropylmalate dehydratase large subunit [Mesosutterella sp. AGMB02718]|uniref:3-isopropylmalate dehydratase n=1 Tax=Mesosutterella faecium TaxID=2925194 RepID=A0ABT7ILM4_9BURK|nr:3-isopropylmalate dehydratase large subunit [Mesosutterella sp. AGMB02718]MDL2058905.1 3-isopropylmalate dehydratase large subunit [Mesosutterella sp. AGMB02718]
MTAPKNLYEKILETHTVKRLDEGTILLYADIHFANEYTSPQAFSGLVQRGAPVLSPDSHLCVVDHIIPTADVTPRVIADPASAKQASTMQENCLRFGIKAFYGPNDPEQGIEHVVMDEQGLVRPGMVVICGDSHTTTHGALGALAFGIGTTEIEHILATQTLVYRLARSMLITISGRLPAGASAKDLALAVLRKVSARGALGCVVEYAGSAVDSLSIEGRMTLCNLTVEAGARGALIAPDEKAEAWVEEHAADLRGEELERARGYWRTLRSDPGAHYDARVEFDASGIEPMVTWGTSPDQSVGISEAIPEPDSFPDPIAREAACRGLRYQGLQPGMKMEGVPIQHVFIGSCTNARLPDLQAAAALLKGRHVAPGVRAQVVPGSMGVRREAEAMGLDRIFRAAGFEWRKSGCSLCLAMNDDVLQPGVRCVSTTNRNFEGRQGAGSRTHLASPQMAAAAAVAGCITDWRKMA